VQITGISIHIYYKLLTEKLFMNECLDCYVPCVKAYRYCIDFSIIIISNKPAFS
jgi:hypothetical protein